MVRARCRLFLFFSSPEAGPRGQRRDAMGYISWPQSAVPAALGPIASWRAFTGRSAAVAIISPLLSNQHSALSRSKNLATEIRLAHLGVRAWTVWTAWSGFFSFPVSVSRSPLSIPLMSPPQRCSAGPQSLPRVRRGADRGGGLWPNVTYFVEKVGASAKRNAHAGRIVHPRTLGYAQMAAADRAEMH